MMETQTFRPSQQANSQAKQTQGKTTERMDPTNRPGARASIEDRLQRSSSSSQPRWPLPGTCVVNQTARLPANHISGSVLFSFFSLLVVHLLSCRLIRLAQGERAAIFSLCSYRSMNAEPGALVVHHARWLGFVFGFILYAWCDTSEPTTAQHRDNRRQGTRHTARTPWPAPSPLVFGARPGCRTSPTPSYQLLYSPPCWVGSNTKVRHKMMGRDRNRLVGTDLDLALLTRRPRTPPKTQTPTRYHMHAGDRPCA